MGNEYYLNISPIDGRYRFLTFPLQQYFSEYAYFRYRLIVEIEYFIALRNLPLPQLEKIDDKQIDQIRDIATNFCPDDYEQIKKYEQKTSHDVKALEYFIKDKFETIGLESYKEFVHFGLTSQDVNSTAFGLMIRNATNTIIIPLLEAIVNTLSSLAEEYKGIAMLSRTHGQPASPTTLGKELKVFVQRLITQVSELKNHKHSIKFGGTNGNFNAHYIAYPNIDWHSFGNSFAQNLQLIRTYPTTQIEPYDNFASYCHIMQRINTILIDFCRDIWLYIMMEYFHQQPDPHQVGSSTMPHKVNPIDFETAEGNLGISNALLNHFAAKLPISRLQRDLTDSTVIRNVGVALAHGQIAYISISKGLNKLKPNLEKIQNDILSHPEVIAEAIQTILRREGYPNPYELLKTLTQNKKITLNEIREFIDSLNIPDKLKNELKAIDPLNYIGKV